MAHHPKISRCPRAARSTIVAIGLSITVVGSAMMCLPTGLGSAPSPEPFPLPGARQMTDDFAFYADLGWSPGGRYLSVTRCPILDFRADCLFQGRAVLLDMTTGASQEVDFSSVTENQTSSSPIAWSPDGSTLLLRLDERLPGEATPSVGRLLLYDLATRGFEELRPELPATPLAWNQDGSAILALVQAEPDQLALAWMSLDGRMGQTVWSFEAENRRAGPYALAPDGRVLLIGDSVSPGDCSQVDALTLDAPAGLQTFLANACYPAWGPDGARLAYIAVRQRGDPQARLMIADGDGSDPSPLYAETLPLAMGSPTWSPDGSQIAFTYGPVEGANAIYVADVPAALRP